jgi:hypothetical protein
MEKKKYRTILKNTGLYKQSKIHEFTGNIGWVGGLPSYQPDINPNIDCNIAHHIILIST